MFLRLRSLQLHYRKPIFLRSNWLLVAVIATAFVPESRAQFTTSGLVGTVLDKSNAAVDEAGVVILNEDTGLTQSTTTNSTGAFTFSALPVGKYKLTVTKAGFSNYIQSGIVLNLGQTVSESIVLTVGATTQSVQVTGKGPMIDTHEATVGQLVEKKLITDLPLNGRQAQSLVFLSPGTVDISNNYCLVNCQGGVYPGEQEASVNGSGPGTVNYQLDGAGHNDTYMNTNLPFPNPDAIEEFNIQSNNLSAQYGGASSAVVNIVTRSGTNALHGDLFEFLRNGDFNARNYFAPVQDTLKQNQFGGSVGGPIIKDRLFYFGTYQGTRVRSTSQSQIGFVPTAPERTGDFSASGVNLVDPSTGNAFANNIIPTTMLNPVAQNILKYVPLPNGPNGQLTYAGPPTRQNDDQWLVKIDADLGKHRLSGRYFWTLFDQEPHVFTDNILAADSNGNKVTVKNYALNDVYVVSPSLFFNTWFGANSQTGGSLSGTSVGFPDLGSQIAAPDPPSLSLSVQGYFGVSTNHKGDFDRGDWLLREDVTKVVGNHELHFGGELGHLYNNLVNTYGMGGSFNFYSQFSGNNLADFLLGNVSQFNQGGGEFKNLSGLRWSAYIQDNWRVSRRLTLNLGLRWEPFLPYKEDAGRVVCFAPGEQSTRFPNAPAGIIYGGSNADSGCPSRSGTNNNFDNFGPRVGFAYRLTNDGKTSLRGGAGIYYIAPMTTQYNAFADTAPFAPQFSLFSVNLTNPFGSAGLANPFPAQYGPKLPDASVAFELPVSIRWYFPTDFRVSQIYTWNLNLERQMGSSWLLRLSYVANKGTYLSNGSKSNRETNPAIYIPGDSTEANTQQRRVYPDFGPIGIYASEYNSNYNAVQASVEKRFSSSLSVIANYSWSKAIDDYGGTDPFNRSFDHGVSDDNIPQIFKLAPVYELPTFKVNRLLGAVMNGWQLSGIVTWRSGFPFSIYSGVDNSFSAVGGDRGDLVGAPTGSIAIGQGKSHADMITEWFDTSLFNVNRVGTFGNTGKNILRGPRSFNTDISAVKRFTITERVSAQLRGEFFNVFNNVNFANPDNYVSDANFGRILSAGSPRIIQIAMKLSF